jgi:hypothetical protein
MVRIERITRPEPEHELDSTGERFKLIEVYVQEPTANPDEESKISARPYEFEGELPSKFSTSCPHCGQGIWFERYEIRSAVDKFFIQCDSCGEGSTAPVQSIIDPFVNPVAEKIAETVLDSDLSKAQEQIDQDTRTVQEKLKDAGVKADNNEQDDEPDEQMGPSEIEQILEELEGKK